MSGDDPRVAIFDLRMVGSNPTPSLLLQPSHFRAGVCAIMTCVLSQRHAVQVQGTCMQFSMWGEVLVTYNDEDAYLFAHPATVGGGQREGSSRVPRRSERAESARRVRRRRQAESSEEEEEGQDAPIARFRGHRNFQTIKGISFFGCVVDVVESSVCIRIRAQAFT